MVNFVAILRKLRVGLYSNGRNDLKVCKCWTEEKGDANHFCNNSVVKQQPTSQLLICLNYPAIKLDSKSLTISYTSKGRLHRY